MASADNPAAVFIPAGTWELRQTISIGSSHVTLRGAGVDATRIYIPFGLAAVYGAAPGWAFGGAFVG